MRLETKRRLAVVLAIMMSLSFVLCGCTKKGGTDDPVVGPKPPIDNPSDNKEAKESMALYEQFLKGETYATADKDFAILDNSIEGNLDFTKQDLVNLFQYVYSGQRMDARLHSAKYAFIDCGLDEVPELALRLGYTDGTSSSQSHEDCVEYLVIKAARGKLNIIASVGAYYRTDASINKAGYVWSGGSSGASSYYDEYSFIDANGALKKIYSCTTELDLAEIKVLPQYLSYKQSQGLTPFVENSDPGYTMLAYNFNSFDPYEVDEGAYDRYLEETMYAFMDYSDMPVMPSAEDMKLYNDRGINVYDVNDMNGFVKQRYEEIGCTDDIILAGEPEWTDIDDVKDMLSFSAQLKTFADNKSLWYVPEAEIPEGAYMYYAVADLDHNGRLEIIRCEKNYEKKNFTKNRFFEIGNDFKSAYKLEYDVETMWSLGEETGYSPDIMDQDYLLCFYNYDFGSALSDYTGTKYIYWAPDRMTFEGGESTLQMTFSLNSSGKVSTGSYCMSVTDINGGLTYMDEAGLDCNKEYFDDTPYRNFSSNDNWYCNRVGLKFIMLRDNDSDATIIEQLTDSYEAIYEDLLYYPGV